MLGVVQFGIWKVKALFRRSVKKEVVRMRSPRVG